MLTPEQKISTLLSDSMFKEWFDDRPNHIQDFISRYPYLKYKVNDNAPYGISSPGTIVFLISYTESLKLKVAVLPENLTTVGRNHIIELGKTYNKDPEEMLQHPHLIEIDPKYLTPIE